MARIDAYLRSMERFGAHSLVLQSNQNILLRFPTGDRHASQATPHELLVGLVREIAPPQALDAVDANRAARFEYSSGGKFSVSVKPTPGSWTVVVEGSAPAASAAAPAPSPPPGPSVASAASTPAAASYTPPIYQSPPGRSSGPTATTPPPFGGADMVVTRTAYDTPGEAPGGASQFLDELLKHMKKVGASDLHLSTGVPPMLRLHGDMVPIEGRPPLEGDLLLRELSAIAPADNRAEFADRSDTDFAYQLPGVSRFRANLFRDRRGPGAVFRVIPFDMPDPAKLGLPTSVLSLCDLSKGLVLVTGPTGSGKSTTLAALIDYINQNRNAHLITIEDPIEFVHPNKKCLVNQREVRTHTRSFKDALRAALREDPDIVLVGELRDLETVAIAIETAETGHLVFGTLHTTTAPGTVDRIIDQFPTDRQEQVRMMLSESLQGVIAQVLCKKVGGGRVAAYEILLGSSAVSNLIREKKTFQLFSVMQTARAQGMTTMNDSLIQLVRSGQVDPKEAYYKAVNKAEFRTLLTKAGFEI
jgi:twitching motility protein PilT